LRSVHDRRVKHDIFRKQRVEKRRIFRLHQRMPGCDWMIVVHK